MKKEASLFSGAFLYFTKGDQHKITLIHEGMRNLEVGLIHGDIIVEQNVDIDGTIAISCAFMPSSEFALYLLGDLQHLTGKEFGLYQNGAIEELVA